MEGPGHRRSNNAARAFSGTVRQKLWVREAEKDDSKRALSLAIHLLLTFPFPQAPACSHPVHEKPFRTLLAGLSPPMSESCFRAILLSLTLGGKEAPPTPLRTVMI